MLTTSKLNSNLAFDDNQLSLSYCIKAILAAKNLNSTIVYFSKGSLPHLKTALHYYKCATSVLSVIHWPIHSGNGSVSIWKTHFICLFSLQIFPSLSPIHLAFVCNGRLPYEKQILLLNLIIFPCNTKLLALMYS